MRQEQTDRLVQADDLTRRFTYHEPPDADRVAAHQAVRRAGRDLAELIVELVPDTPERKRAIDAVDDAVMLANAGLARGNYPTEV